MKKPARVRKKWRLPGEQPTTYREYRRKLLEAAADLRRCAATESCGCHLDAVELSYWATEDCGIGTLSERKWAAEVAESLALEGSPVGWGGVCRWPSGYCTCPPGKDYRVPTLRLLPGNRHVEVGR